MASIEALRARRGVKWRRFPDDVLPAWVADMDLGVAEPVRRAIARLVEQSDYGYPWREAADGLEAAFADRMRERFGWEVCPELVLPVTDLVQAIVASLVAFSEPGDGVVMHTPAYPPFMTAVERTGRRMIASPLVDDGSRLAVDLDDLRRAADAGARVLMLCNPHNPSGRVLERDVLEAIGALAVERDLVIVSDEIHCDLVYAGHRHVPIGALGGEVGARTVTLNSATKGFNIAGLRCGVLHLGSEALRDRFDAAIPFHLLGAPGSFGVDATVAAWRLGQPWLDGVMATLAANRQRVAAWAASQGPPLRHHPPEGTYLAWLDCSRLELPCASPHELFLERARVALSDGAEFGPGGEGCVRLNFATTPAILEEILDRMSRALRPA